MATNARYSGPATLIVDGDGSWPVEVSLIAEQDGRGLKSWHGSMQATEDAQWAALNASPARLQMPDGRTGEFIFSAGRVTGSGAAPFGDL